MVRPVESLLACAALLLSPSEPAAQGLVLPGSHATREGTTTTNVPFGRGTPMRVQCLYDGMLLPGPRQITALALRLDGGATAAGKSIDVEIRMSTAPQPLTGTSAMFASNRGGDETVVLGRRVLALPAQSAPASPSPFSTPIPLDVSFGYDPAAGPLCIEIVVHGQPPGAYPLDATFVCDSPAVPVGPPACQPGGVQPLRVASATTGLLWGRPWLSRALDLPPGSLVAMGFGGRDTGAFQGWNLPHDLAALGAPGCFLSIELLATRFRTALPDGTATFTLTIPARPELVGAEIYFQAGAVVPGANALGVITSQARRVAVCGFEPVARVWSSGIVDPLGVRELGIAPVVRLTVQ